MANVVNANGSLCNQRITVQWVNWRLVANIFTFVIDRCAKLELDVSANKYQNNKGNEIGNLYELMGLCDTVSKLSVSVTQNQR